MVREHPKWSLKTLQHRGSSALTRKDDLRRWENHIIKGGTQYDKSKISKDWTYKRFIEAREKKIPVYVKNLQEWAIQAAMQFNDENFTFTA